MSTRLVVDMGSGTIKGGGANYDRPAAIFEAGVSHVSIQPPWASSSLKAIMECENELPYGGERWVKRGRVASIEALPLIIRTVAQKAQMPFEAQFPLLLTEPTLTSLKEKKKRLAILFEGGYSRYLFSANQGLLALLGHGLVAGLSIESGADLTQIVPVVEGRALPRASEVAEMGGSDVTTYLELMLRRRGCGVVSAQSRAFLEKIKHTNCECAPALLESIRFGQRSGIGESDIKKKYISSLVTLPDGEEIALAEEKTGAAELLFNPGRAGLSCASLSEMLAFVLQRVEPDLRKIITKNICISGGNTMLKGFDERMENEIKALLPYTDPQNICADGKNRAFGVWKGGASLIQLTAFNALWITKREWDEFGDTILLQKQL